MRFITKVLTLYLLIFLSNCATNDKEPPLFLTESDFQKKYRLQKKKSFAKKKSRKKIQSLKKSLAQNNSIKDTQALKKSLVQKMATTRKTAGNYFVECSEIYEDEFSNGGVSIMMNCDLSESSCMPLGFGEGISNNCDETDQKKLLRYRCNCEIKDNEDFCKITKEPIVLKEEIICENSCEKGACLKEKDQFE